MDFFTHVTALAALAVVAVHQILKLNFVPVSFANRYPVPTNILLSVVASIIVAWQSNVSVSGWSGWLLLVATISVTAAIVYNSLLRPWNELRASEAPTNKTVV